MTDASFSFAAFVYVGFLLPELMETERLWCLL